MRKFTGMIEDGFFLMGVCVFAEETAVLRVERENEMV